jgi:hypothetical protein
MQQSLYSAKRFVHVDRYDDGKATGGGRYAQSVTYKGE